MIRTYFHQLIEGLEYIHSKGFAHFDLKLENLVLGRDSLLKIIDFGQAQKTATDEEITSGGTVGYLASEVQNRTCKDSKAVDIYSAGIVLFTLKAKDYLFVESKKILILRYILPGNKTFWKSQAKKTGSKVIFSDSFKSLLNGMLHDDSCKILFYNFLRNCMSIFCRFWNLDFSHRKSE